MGCDMGTTIKAADVDRRFALATGRARSRRADHRVHLGCVRREGQHRRGSACGPIVWAKPVDISNLDPQVTANASDWEFFSLVYDSPVTLDNSGHVVPSLATAWTRKSPTTYVFTLRPPGAPRV
jgi:ABC-type transport system substrate-binding protein